MKKVHGLQELHGGQEPANHKSRRANNLQSFNNGMGFASGIPATPTITHEVQMTQTSNQVEDREIQELSLRKVGVEMRVCQGGSFLVVGETVRLLGITRSGNLAVVRRQSGQIILAHPDFLDRDGWEEREEKRVKREERVREDKAGMGRAEGVKKRVRAQSTLQSEYEKLKAFFSGGSKSK